MKKMIFATLAFLFVSFSTYAWANEKTEAQNVIENFFAAMKAQQLDTAANFLAPQFFSIQTDGITRDKNAEMVLIKNIHMKKYHLSDFKFSQSGDIIVVTFKNKGEEKIDKKPIGTQTAGRMAVLQKQDGKWLIVAWANLDTID